MESVLKFITNTELSPELLDAGIKTTRDLTTLNALLDIKMELLKNSSKHKKIPFDLYFIYADNTENIHLICTVLKKALQVSSDMQEALIKICSYVNQNSKDCHLTYNLICILNNLLLFCSEQNSLTILFQHLSSGFLSDFLLNALVHKEARVQALETLKYYLSIISLNERIECLNKIFSLVIEKNDLNVLSAILNQVSGDLMENKDSFFSDSKFWMYLECCISGNSAHLQKMAEFILFKCVTELQKNNSNPYIAVTRDSADTWKSFFVLLDIGREKQLHLVEPSLELLKYLGNLPFLWQKCIYSIYLRHSQSIIVYKTAIHILTQEYDEDNLRGILKLLLPAINKHEYSELSSKMFEIFKEFCVKLDNNEFRILIKEILHISWTPFNFWKVVQNVFTPDKKMQINIDYFQDLICYAVKLPHIYIRKECIQYLINFFWNPRSFFKMFKILCALQKNNLNYYEYSSCCEFSQDIIEFVINELLNLSDDCNDPSKAKVCFVFLKNIIFDVLEPPVDKYLNKLHPHIKILIWDFYWESFLQKSEQPALFCMEIEQFLIQYFDEYLHEETTGPFVQLIGSLINARHPPENIVKHIMMAVNDGDKFEPNQVYSAFTVLARFYNLLFRKVETIEINVGYTVLKNWRQKIIKERDERIVMEYINLIFSINYDNFSLQDTLFIIHLFTELLECQSNKVLQYIYEKTCTLVTLSEYPELVVEFTDMSCRYIKTLKKDQYFKNLIDKLISVVYSPISFFNNLKNLSFINKELLKLSNNYPIIRLHFIRNIHKLLQKTLNYWKEVLPISLEIYLQGMLVKRECRIEFYTCQEFLQNTTYDSNPWSLNESSNPNLISASSRFLALEVLLLIAKHDTDSVINCLREKYLTYFKKRYFPGSEIHFLKLRITQALMMLVPYAKQSIKSRRQISVFIYDCFLEEANQNCIKQLFNWILILLLRIEGFAVIEYIRRITTTPNPASASVLIGLAPAVYHLTVFGNEEAFNETIKLALPWTMEAQFKLRLYAQDLIMRIFKHAQLKGYTNFVAKYKHLEDCINSCIVSTGDVYENTMKTDLLFLNDFDLTGDNSLKTIFYDIPRLNNVCPTEWQSMYYCISKPEYLKDNTVLVEQTPLDSICTTFSDAVDHYLNKNQNSIRQTDNTDVVTSNIQKKITPWKTALENNSETNKSDFILIASLIDKPQNLGGLSRTCEVYGITTLVLSDIKVITNKEFTSLSMSSESWINTVEVKVNNLEGYISKCRNEGYCVAGAEQTADSIKLNEFKFPKKTALILGNEKTGIPSELLPLLDVCLEIPQYGQVRSLNVHVAGATFVWEYVKQHLA